MDWPRVSEANHAIYGGQRTRYNTCMLSDHPSTYAHTHVAFINVVMHGTSESRAGVTLISAANHVVMHGTSESRATHGTSEYRCTVALLPGTVQSECRCTVQSECRCNAQSECRCTASSLHTICCNGLVCDCMHAHFFQSTVSPSQHLHHNIIKCNPRACLGECFFILIITGCRHPGTREAPNTHGCWGLRECLCAWGG